MKNVKQKFLQRPFLQNDHQGFPENVEVRLIDKKQTSVYTSVYLDGLNIESALCLLHTFIITFSSYCLALIDTVLTS